MKLSTKHSIFILTLIVLAISSCKPSVPSKFIQPDEMEDILYDYHLSQALAQENYNSDSVSFYRNMYYRSLLEHHGVTQEQFDSSLVYYYSHAYKLHDIYRNISNRMNENMEKYGAAMGEIGKYTQYNTDGDTANVWTTVSSAILVPKPTVNRFEFSIEADTTYQRGDSFLFNFMTTFLYQSGTKDAMLYMAVEYDNDSVYAQTRRVSVTGLTQLKIKANEENDVKRIKGFIYLHQGNDDSKTLKLMFVDQIQLIRFHPETPVDTTKFAKKDTVAADSVKSDSILIKADTAIQQKKEAPLKMRLKPIKTEVPSGNTPVKMKKTLNASDIKLKKNEVD